MPKTRAQGGFTLVELIIVLAILGVLAAILIPTMTGMVADARDTVCMENRRQVKTMFMYNTYKTSLTDPSAAFQETLDTYFSGKEQLCPSGGAYTWDESSYAVLCSVHGQKEEGYTFDFSTTTSQVKSTMNYYHYIMDFLATPEGEAALATTEIWAGTKSRLDKSKLNKALLDAGYENPVSGLADSAIYFDENKNFIGAMIAKGGTVSYFLNDGTVFVTTTSSMKKNNYGNEQNAVFTKLRADIASGKIPAAKYDPNKEYTPFDFSTLK